MTTNQLSGPSGEALTWNRLRPGPPAPGEAHFGYPQPDWPLHQTRGSSSLTEIAGLIEGWDVGPDRPGERPVQHARHESRERSYWVHVFGYPLAILAGLLIGASAIVSSHTTAAAASVPVPAQLSDEAAAPPAIIASTAAAQGAAGPAVAPIRTTTIPGNGTFVVGRDIQAGTYGTADPGYNCYWARLKNTEGGLESIITNGNSIGRTTVTIRPTDVAFETNGCRPWARR